MDSAHVTDGLWLRSRSGFPSQVMFVGGFHGLYGAQQCAQHVINLDSVAAIAIVELDGVPEDSRTDFGGKYMLMLSPPQA